PLRGEGEIKKFLGGFAPQSPPRTGPAFVGLVLACLVLGACAPGSGGAPSTEAARPAIQRVLVAGIRAEPTSIALKSIGSSSFAGNSMVTRYFNADVTRVDQNGAVQPYLAAEVPALNSDTWRVTPDGRMEITWKFRPGIGW